MRIPTIHERREKSIIELAQRSPNYNNDFETVNRARHIMNIYYRLCGLDGRLLILENQPETQHLKATLALEEKAEKMRCKLHSLLEEFNADINYSGAYPSFIEREKSPEGGVVSLHHLSHFYQ